MNRKTLQSYVGDALMCEDNSVEFDVDNILRDAVDDQHVENLAEISQHIFDVIHTLNLDQEIKEQVIEQLAGYTFIDDLSKLKNGRFIKTISLKEDANKNSAKNPLRLFGFCVGKYFTDSGTLISCIINKRYFKYNFDNYLTFQHLSNESLERIAINNVLQKLTK